jgi:two-component system response regulator DevR
VVLTGPTSDIYVPDAIKAGCSCFASTDLGSDELIAAVRHAGAGQPHMNEAFLQRYSDQLDSGADASTTVLTERERQVLTLAADGLTSRAIADALDLSINTVRHHIQNVLTKLGAHSKLEAITAALRSGLIPPRS